MTGPGIRKEPGPFFWCAQHEHDQEVQVLWGSWSQRPRANRKAKKRREPSDREVGAERSGERNRASTNRNRISDAAEQGERALIREALATKAKRRRSGDGAGNARVLTWGDLALRLKGRRPSKDDAEREVSRGRSTVEEAGRGDDDPERPEGFGDGKDRTEGRASRP